MHTGVLWELVHWLSLPVLPVIAFLLFRRKALKHFPLFSSYVIVSFLIVLTRLWFQLALASHSIAYLTAYYAYWITELVVTIFVLSAICELFLVILFARFHKVIFYRYLFACI